MASENSFVQPTIPRFDGHYDHWKAQRKTLDDQRLKDLKTKNYLFQVIDRAILKTILKKDTTKDIWDSMKTKYQGTARVKLAQLQALHKEFEILHMKEEELVNYYFARTLSIANKMRIHGENLEDVAIIEKILLSMTHKFDYVVCSIEESNDINSLSIDVLQSSLLVHEQRMTSYVVEEQALKVSTHEGTTSLGRGRRRRGLHGSSRGRGRQLSYNQGAQFNKASVECYHCHKLGHYQYECPDKEKETKVNFVKTKGEILLMAYIDKKEISSGDIKFHMKNNTVQTISNMFYIPDLKSNLISMGQLQERGYIIIIPQSQCQIHHPEKGLIVEAKMTANHMFLLHIQYDAQKCLSTRVQDPTWLWHLRYGHLSFKGLKTLHEKNMVEGLPKINCPTEMCEDCIVDKQHHDSFPQGKAWRTEQILQLVHSNICGEINPTSNGNKSFKTQVEKESGKYIQILRTNRGGEFNSHNFASFCELHGIRRQLTARYTPQQNDVVERKNQTIMNMVRSILLKKSIPKTLWTEAINWSVHVLN
ncbi:unnamed protein product [Prunus armeniaca]